MLHQWYTHNHGEFLHEIGGFIAAKLAMQSSLSMTPKTEWLLVPATKIMWISGFHSMHCIDTVSGYVWEHVLSVLQGFRCLLGFHRTSSMRLLGPKAPRCVCPKGVHPHKEWIVCYQG